jgi:hypothetical protein
VTNPDLRECADTATGRIVVGSKDNGSGFAVGARLVLTANHVIRNQDVSSIRFQTAQGEPTAIDRVESAEDIDVALLHSSTDIARPLEIGRASEGAMWLVDATPLPNDPSLTGTIDSKHRSIRNAQGHEVAVMQLLVAQVLGSYRGYSGSPILLKAFPCVVVGLLVEQVPLRTASMPGQPPPAAANVLYAIAIEHAISRFGISSSLLRQAQTPLVDATELQQSTPVDPQDLTGAQREQIAEALLAAFPSPAALERVLNFGLDTHLLAVANMNGTYVEKVDQLVEWVVSQGRLCDLIVEARKRNHGNTKLRAVERAICPSN